MLFASLIVTVWVLLGWFYYQASSPVNEDTQTVLIKIEPGMTLKQVSILLKKENLIIKGNKHKLKGSKMEPFLL